MSEIEPLAANVLRVCMDETMLNFKDTLEIEPLQGVLGQQRALESLAAGLAMERAGYNLYVMGSSGTGRMSLVTDLLRSHAKQQPTPDDWIYMNQFSELREPVAASLPAGQGSVFIADMDHVVDSLLATFPAAFDNPSLQRQKSALEREFSDRYARAIDAVQREAEVAGILMLKEGDSISFVANNESRAIESDKATGVISGVDVQRDNVPQRILELEDSLREALLALPQWKREASEQLRALNRETVVQATDPLLLPLLDQYANYPVICDYLASIRAHLQRTVMEILYEDKPGDPREEAARRQALRDAYIPRLLVSHVPDAGAPMLQSMHPGHVQLFGRMDPPGESLGSPTVHAISPGLLHQANGGYLILDAEDVIADSLVWQTLKRTLKTAQIRMEPPAGDGSPPIVPVLSPAPIPLHIKIVLVGPRDLYYLLDEDDHEFKDLFRIPVDFDDYFPRTADTTAAYARLIATQIQRENLAPATAAAVGRLMEHSIRQAEHQGRLSARIGDLCETLVEANSQRRLRHAQVIDVCDITAALNARQRRLGRMSEDLLLDVLEGVILIETEGVAVGRVNGLTVFEAGDACFAMPARITATASPGERGVVDIEREADLGQSIHSKGVLILSGYLGYRYAKDFTLAISAHLAIEQSYGYVDGDSASLAELCAFLSALTRLPVRQGLALTGSINQHGEVQAIGGVNEKIEGFYRLCAARGLGGQQGVIIPAANARNLMLAPEVVNACSAGNFSIYAVQHVDEVLALLTGKSAVSVNRMAVSRLRSFASLADGAVTGHQRRH